MAAASTALERFLTISNGETRYILCTREGVESHSFVITDGILVWRLDANLSSDGASALAASAVVEEAEVAGDGPASASASRGSTAHDYVSGLRTLFGSGKEAVSLARGSSKVTLKVPVGDHRTLVVDLKEVMSEPARQRELQRILFRLSDLLDEKELQLRRGGSAASGGSGAADDSRARHTQAGRKRAPLAGRSAVNPGSKAKPRLAKGVHFD